MTSCLKCGATVASTKLGMIERKSAPLDGYPPAVFVERHWGSVNHPCGCIDGGLQFEAAS